jgi:glycosyltransferase involved in cell wall biosynthesis
VYLNVRGNTVKTVIVDHVTFSKTGGAGEVASLLVGAQKEMGLDSNLISLIDKDLRAEPLAIPSITVAAAIDELVVSNHSSPTIISLYRSSLNKIKTGDLRDNSIVHLHWISGLIGHQQVKCLLDSGRKVVWTLHDMAPFTGVCHHSHGCDGFEKNCQNCPQVRSAFKNAVRVNLEQKFFQGVEKNLVLVAPTPWMAEQALKSSALRHQRIEVIENPIRDEFYQASSERVGILGVHGLTSHEPLVLSAVASDLSNPAKGIQELVKIFLGLRGLNDSIKLNLIGRRGNHFHQPSSGIYWRGSLDTKSLIGVMEETHLLVSASKAESAGLTVREFGALGIPTIAIRSGGIQDLIKDGLSGILVNDFFELENQLRDLVKTYFNPLSLGKRAMELALENRPNVSGQKYLNLYRSI